MELEAAIAVVSAVAGGAASEAGRHAWESLLALARRAVGRPEPGPAAGTDPAGAGPEGAQPAAPAAAAPPEGPDPDTVDPADPEAVRALTGRIAAVARADETFAAELLRWAELHRTAAPATLNVISGQAQVRTAVQTGTVHGGIHLGGA